MPSLLAHLWQAGHNEKLAKELVESMTYKDWATTITYYAAIHYVEAAFSQDNNILHTEAQIQGRSSRSMHSIREDIILRYYGSAWEALRKLHIQSNIARYLNTQRQEYMKVPVQDYFSDTDVRNFFEENLATIKRVMGIS